MSNNPSGFITDSQSIQINWFHPGCAYPKPPSPGSGWLPFWRKLSDHWLLAVFALSGNKCSFIYRSSMKSDRCQGIVSQTPWRHWTKYLFYQPSTFQCIRVFTKN